MSYIEMQFQLESQTTATDIATAVKRSPNARLASSVCESFCKNDEILLNYNLKHSIIQKIRGKSSNNNWNAKGLPQEIEGKNRGNIC